MTESKAQYGTRTLVILAGMAAALVLCAVCGRAVLLGFGLQDELVRGTAIHASGQQLGSLVEAGADRELDRQVRQLVREAGIGLTYLAVSDSQGKVLAFDGRFEQMVIPLLSQLARQKLRGWLYQLTSERGNFQLTQNGRSVGQVEYAVSPLFASRVREEAISELRLVSWVGLVLSLLAMGALGYLFMRQPDKPSDPQIIARSQQEAPNRIARSLEQDPAEEEITETLRRHGIHTLDSLKRALIVVDDEARVTFMNRTAAEITGWSVEEARGRLVYSVFHPLDEDESPLVTPVETCLREGREYDATELTLRARDGKTLQAIEVMAALLRTGPDSHQGAAMVFHLIEERKHLIDHLKRQARLSLTVIDQLVEGVFTTDPRGVIRSANARACRMFGYAKGELEGTLVTQLMPMPFLKERDIRLTEYIGGRRGNRAPKVTGWRRDTSTFPIDLVVQPMKVDNSEGLVVIVRDDTERTRSENLSQRLGRLLDAAADEVYIFDARSLQFVEVNHGARQKLGRENESLSQLTMLDISRKLEPTQFEADLDRLRSGRVEQLSYRSHHVRSDGSDYPVEVRLSYSSDEEPPVFLAIAVDVSDREQEETDLRHLARHDGLTGLINRVTLIDRMEQGMLVADRGNRLLSACVIDLDRFGAIRDNHGQDVADQVLIETARRLEDRVRACDTVARIAGDEFVVMSGDVRGPEEAEALAKKLMAVFDTPFEVESHKLHVAASLGLAMYPLDPSGAEGLLRHAAAAMAAAKQAGGGRYQLFDAPQSPERQREFELERSIGAALTLQQIDVDAHMAVELEGANAGRVRAVLLDFAWHHPSLGRISVADMRASARRAGITAELELWQIYQACTLLPAPDESDLDAPLLPIIVRISAWQLRDKLFYSNLFELMNRHSVPPRRLILAADGAGIEHLRQAPSPQLKRLRDRGVRLALHGDAGPLFSALDKAEGLPLDLIVVDPDEVQKITVEEQATEHMRLSMMSAKSLGVPVLVSGVVSEAARDWLVTQGAGLGCGAFLGEPVVASQLRRQLEQSDEVRAA